MLIGLVNDKFEKSNAPFGSKIFSIFIENKEKLKNNNTHKNHFIFIFIYYERHISSTMFRYSKEGWN